MEIDAENAERILAKTGNFYHQMAFAMIVRIIQFLTNKEENVLLQTVQLILSLQEKVNANHALKDLIQTNTKDNALHYNAMQDKKLFKKSLFQNALTAHPVPGLKKTKQNAELIHVIQQRDNSPVMMDFAFDVQIIKL
jgi:hypothetical protein